MNFSSSGMAPAPVEGRHDSSGRMTVLVVDDSPAVLALLRGFLAREGYEVLVATNGVEALKRMSEASPDLVVMDVMMPELDGLETVRRIREQSVGHPWIPVIFVSALDTEDDAVRALDAGGDDFIAKPVNLAILRAKMRSMARVAALQRELRHQAAALRSAQEEEAAEQELAQDLIANIVLREGVNDPVLEWSVLPSQRFSGDVVAAARAPDGALYALLADATGHGLTASVSLIPALQVFYGMAKKGLPVPEIVSEMNARLKDLMPAGRCIAAVLLRLSPDSLSGEAWNGGMPPLFLLDGEGRARSALVSRHLPLGIASQHQFDATTQPFAGERGGTLAVFSDGVLEAAGESSGAFGTDRALAAIRGVAPGSRMASLRAALTAHLGVATRVDDASALLVRLG
ncbi:MAG: response regulator [Betaproteobacteria bacterium]|jgi:DNA-binding response OmpR family regulator|nr:response regulator [Rhodocyclaceae bacterium]MCA3134489.1 response regulator [Rhodocyclaceae bacterium]MCA3143945.1 response regulator [Rhodocyclaceae bacterium]MCA3145680.1 response regulator [Rhodocyclaceae bacterium]MCE2898534.1 response regulator [Betaproteobacteria bacterium]